MILKRLITTLFLIITVLTQNAVPQQYYTFNNLEGLTQKLCVRSIAQSADGMIWLATESGLYSYDGYHLIKRPVGESSTCPEKRGSFNCMLSAGDSLLIGCNKGVLSFNLKTYCFRTLPYAATEMIQGIVRTDSIIWVATGSAIYRNGVKLEPGLNNIVSLYSDPKYLYIGTSEAAFCYSIEKQQFQKITEGISYATCFLADSRQDLLWIGTATNITARRKKEMKPVCSIAVPVAKALCTDNRGNVLAGTDNGLYIIGKNHRAKVILHDARREKSLAGDAVWCIFRDRSNNIWTGTNSGVSLVPETDLMIDYSLPAITGEGMGNQFFCTFIDSRGRYWLGGYNGLLCIEPHGKEDLSYRWYRMNDPRYPIPHNRIRDIMETTDGTILIGGDMGVMLYNEASRQFQRYEIKEDPYNWVYGIRETGNSELAITTFTATYIATLNKASHTVIVRTIKEREDLSVKTNRQKALLSKYGLSENYLSAFNDTVKGTVLLGGTDRFSVLNTKRLNEIRRKSQLFLTDIRINNERYAGRQAILDRRLTVQPDDKIVELLFSDFNYAGELTQSFQYRIDNGEWMPVNSGNNSITLTNLSPGKFTIGIGLSGTDREAVVVELVVKAPWYASGMAKLIYFLLFTFLIYGIYQFIHQRKRIRQDKLEYETLVQNTRQKEKELLDDNEYLSFQLRLRLLAKAGDDGILSQDEKLLLKITKIIEENMSDLDLNVNTLCELSGFSSKQLYRKIKATTGMTAVAYIRDQRLKKAASLLSKGTFTVSEVMYMVGFSNASYFTRCFTEEFKTPPSEYRSVLQKEM